jgi:hypothetical protein
MPLLAAFFNESELAQFSGDTMTTEPIDIKLPSLEMFSSAYTDDIALMNTQSLQLNRIAEKSKNNSVIFESLAHKLTHDLAENELDIVSSEISVFSYQFMILMGTTALSILLAVLVFIMHTKIKSITMALCIVQRVQAANAQVTTNKPIVFDFFRDQTTSMATSIKYFIPELSKNVEVLDALLILTLCTFASYVIYKSYQLRHFRHQYSIYAEIGNSEHHVKIKLTTLRHSPNLYDFVASRFVSTITVTGSLHPRMHLSWPELSIIHKCTHITTHLKPVHNISYYESYKLSDIIADSYYILFFTKAPDNVFNLVQLNGTEWQMIHPMIMPRRNDDFIPLRHLPNLTAGYANPSIPSYTETAMNSAQLKRIYPQI